MNSLWTFHFVRIRLGLNPLSYCKVGTNSIYTYFTKSTMLVQFELLLFIDCPVINVSNVRLWWKYSCSTKSISVKCGVDNQCLCIISMNFIVFRWQWQHICGISDENGILCAIAHWHNSMCYRNVRTMH